MARHQTPGNPPLRYDEPLDVVVTDLEGYIPERMDASTVPGLSVALVRDGQVAWVAGFGVANRLTGAPVTPETVFEVASISKVVAAYAALRLVDEGYLELDDPLAASLSTPWLPSSEYAEQITLRHVASHSSGLRDTDIFPTDKSIAFRPGSAFSYSGVGFLYLQEVIEEVTGSSLEEAAQRSVFEPLGMSSSSFMGRAVSGRPTASGHVSYSLPLLLFLMPFVGIFGVLTLAAVSLRRIHAGTWRPTRNVMAGIATGAAVIALLLVFLTVGRPVPNLALLALVIAAAFAVAGVLVSLVVRKIVARLARPVPSRLSYVLAMTVAAAAMVGLSATVKGPMPGVLSPPASAVASLRTTAPDLATFLAEAAAPRLLSDELAGQLSAAQIAVDKHFAWGLGIGIQYSDHGDALWHNGITPGFRSAMVIYPEHKWGVVVLTNSDDGLPVAYDVAARALGGKAHWASF